MLDRCLWKWRNTPSLFLRAALVIAGLSLTACADKTHDHEKEKIVVGIGFSGPLTGNTAHVGKDYQNGILLAIDDLNGQHITVNQRPVSFQLLSENDAGDPRTATIAAALLSDKKVLAVIGHVDSGCTIAASATYHKANIIQIAPSVSNQKYTNQGFDNTFRLMAPDTVQGKFIARYIRQLDKGAAVALIDDGSAYGQNLCNQVESALKKENTTVIAREYTYRNNLDYGAILTQINKTNANFLFFAGTDVQAARLIKQERAFNKHIIFMTGDMACTPRFIALSEKYAEGTICSRNALPLNDLPHAVAFKNRYEKRFSVPLQPYALFSYDATVLVGHAIKATGTLDKTRIIHYLHKSKYNGLTGLISFQENGDPEIPNVTIFRISRGRFHVEKIFSDDPFSCVKKERHRPRGKSQAR